MQNLKDLACFFSSYGLEKAIESLRLSLLNGSMETNEQWGKMICLCCRRYSSASGMVTLIIWNLDIFCIYLIPTFSWLIIFHMDNGLPDDGNPVRENLSRKMRLFIRMFKRNLEAVLNATIRTLPHPYIVLYVEAE